MAMNLKTISEWLDEEETRHQLIEEKDLIVFGAQGDVQTSHWIRLKEDGDMFNYQIQLRKGDENYMVPNDVSDDKLLVLLKYLMYENYTTKFGCWEYDHTDGDIRFAIEIPLEDGELTKKQFERIFSLSVGNVDTMMAKIETVLETGEFPEEEDSSDKLMALLERLKDSIDDEDESSSRSPKKKSIAYDDDDGI